MAQGLYRTKEGWAREDSVRVRYKEGNELDIPASLYVAHGFYPPLDDLPWCESHA